MAEPRYVESAGRAICIALLLSVPLRLPAQTVVYVRADHAAGPSDGRSWETAYRSVQEGIDDAAEAGGGEVWVAAGTYTPTSAGDRSVSIELRPGVTAYGGFAGTETSRDQRDWRESQTVLSGDIGVPGDHADNSYHVVKGADDAVLDGFTITGGNADGRTYDGKGGGMVNYANLRALSEAARRVLARPPGRRGPGPPGGGGAVLAGTGVSPEVRNCVFVENRAREGGAMYNFDGACPTIADCIFDANAADKGGAIVNRMAASATVTECAFMGNRARWRGGAVFNDYGASATFTDCTFEENATDGNGGGLYTDDTSSQIGYTSPLIERCTFTRNRAGLRGGGIALYNKCTPTVTGCTFAGNHAGKGGGAMSLDYRVTAAVSDCTFADNTAEEGDADIDIDGSSAVTD